MRCCSACPTRRIPRQVDAADAGVMISASHNAFEDNGIKLSGLMATSSMTTSSSRSSKASSTRCPSRSTLGADVGAFAAWMRRSAATSFSLR